MDKVFANTMSAGNGGLGYIVNLARMQGSTTEHGGRQNSQGQHTSERGRPTVFGGDCQNQKYRRYKYIL